MSANISRDPFSPQRISNQWISKKRWTGLLLALALSLHLVACSGASESVVPTPPTLTRYTALGASDAVGFNASVSCDGPANTAGIRPQRSDPLDCPNGTGYVPRLAQSLPAPVQLTNLGRSGAVISPTIQALGDSFPANLLQDQVPRIPPDTTLITLWIGGNDTNAITLAAVRLAIEGGDPFSFIDRQIEQFASDYQTLLQFIRARAPQTRIVVANLPNFALIPLGQQQPDSARQLLATVSLGLSQRVINPLSQQGIPVVDLLCDPRSYSRDSFFPGPIADGFHPNDQGYADLADAFLRAIQQPTPPQPSCPPFSERGSWLQQEATVRVSEMEAWLRSFLNKFSLQSPILASADRGAFI
ncbi:GDSL-type esterase/lipase family protein [Synechococcus sp. Nb3U1]|uniref:SGNH/GDSL hydrolase family protein n=1 Tax=Synechococcus sp. Nb3U1 TaxID=1914529 RepID=UPI001F3C9511|nr:GDSL-type esterase/lipase family protein [Synechococcus sp. Nb3U1]MCF2971868.1 GDSL-type esterase/lipase family protein [Synechococcus sp. Nb3U1]